MNAPLQITITRGHGTASTGLAAFDAALYKAGIGNVNLITLSSVIPPGASIRCDGLTPTSHNSQDRWGDRLYCVLAECRVDEPGREAWAGLSWWQDQDRRGLFVEHHGHSKQAVIGDLQASIRNCVERRGLRFGDGRSGLVVEGRRCVDRPVCALVAATYETQDWQAPGSRPLL